MSVFTELKATFEFMILFFYQSYFHCHQSKKSFQYEDILKVLQANKRDRKRLPSSQL